MKNQRPSLPTLRVTAKDLAMKPRPRWWWARLEKKWGGK